LTQIDADYVLYKCHGVGARPNKREHLCSSVFICVHLCQSVAKINQRFSA
jgi:hypothetical protein